MGSPSNSMVPCVTSNSRPRALYKIVLPRRISTISLSFSWSIVPETVVAMSSSRLAWPKMKALFTWKLLERTSTRKAMCLSAGIDSVRLSLKLSSRPWSAAPTADVSASKDWK